MRIFTNYMILNKLGGGKHINLLPIIVSRHTICIGFVLCIGLFCAFGTLSSCHSEDLPQMDAMQALFAESQTLSEVGEDSCTAYIQKFIDKVNTTPSLIKSEYYQPTFRNIYRARTLYNIDISLSVAGWNEPVFVDFEFGQE